MMSSPDLHRSLKRTSPQSSGSPGLMLFPRDGGCVLYDPIEGNIQTSLGDFPGCRFLANSGNWLLVLDSGSSLYIIDVFSKETIPLPSLESIKSADCIVKRVGDREFIREESGAIYKDLSADVVRGLLWVSESGKEYVVLWLFDLPGHSYMSFCKNGDTHYTDIPLVFDDYAFHKFDGLSDMVLRGTRLYVSTSRRFVRVFDLSGPQEELKRSKINFFIDEDETRGRRITTLFETIRESGVALILLSNKYSDSHWCLDELVEIKKQMETGYLDAFPVFYEVKSDSVKRQTGSFGNTLLKTEDKVRSKVDRGSYKSILETEARIWGWRQALVYIGGSFGFSHKKEDPDGPLIINIVVQLKKMLDEISYRRNYLFIIEKSLMHPQEALTSLLRALNIKKSDLEDLITRPFIQTRGTDHLVFLDLISLKNPILGQRLIKRVQDGMIFLVLLGSVDGSVEDVDFKPRLLSRKPRLFPGNKLIVSPQEIQEQSYFSPVQVSNVLAMAESNENTRNRLGVDNNSDCSLTCFSSLCNIMKRFAMMINPPPPRVFISFGEKQLEKNLDVPRLAQSVKQMKGCFRNRLLKIEQEVRKTVNRDSVNSILDTEARIWEWRQAILSISSRPGLSNENSSDPVFFTDVVTKVNELFEFKAIPKKSSSYIITNQLIEEKPIMHQQKTAPAIPTVKSLDDDLFYSLPSFLQALDLEITDLEGFTEMHNGLISLSLKRHNNLVCLNLGSLEKLVHFRSDPVFFTDVVTKVNELFEFKAIPKKSSSYIITNQLIEEKPIMHQQKTAPAIPTVKSLDDDLFYSLPSFLQALDLEITDLEGFTEMHNGLISLSLKRHNNLVCLNLGSLEKLVHFRCSDSFDFLSQIQQLQKQTCFETGRFIWYLGVTLSHV
ncbi:hypothetical protein DY000_02038016 [Brassica cretica]|uniref:TIR domain-containing protein n=1 Tax=Brassica cretica TaxID=69181 RepID=A0ABQ7BMZ5_BRACR|nr:hypothetical protein DY000_02038016 [Brassica cretica]